MSEEEEERGFEGEEEEIPREDAGVEEPANNLEMPDDYQDEEIDLNDESLVFKMDEEKIREVILALQAQVKSKDQECKQLKAENEQLASELEKLSSEYINEKQDQIDQFKKIKGYEEEFRKIQAETAEYLTLVRAHKEKYETAEQDKQRIGMALLESSEINKKLKALIVEKDRMIDKMTTEMDKFIKIKDEFEPIIKLNAQLKQGLEEKDTELQKVSEALTSKIEESKELQAKLEEASQLMEQMPSIEEFVKTTSATVDEMREENSKLRKQTDEVVQTNEQLLKLNEELQRDLERCMSTEKEMKAVMDMMEQAVDLLSKENSGLKMALTTLKKEYDIATKELQDAKEAKSQPTEKQPTKIQSKISYPMNSSHEVIPEEELDLRTSEEPERESKPKPPTDFNVWGNLQTARKSNTQKAEIIHETLVSPKEKPSIVNDYNDSEDSSQKIERIANDQPIQTSSKKIMSKNPTHSAGATSSNQNKPSKPTNQPTKPKQNQHIYESELAEDNLSQSQKDHPQVAHNEMPKLAKKQKPKEVANRKEKTETPTTSARTERLTNEKLDEAAVLEEIGRLRQTNVNLQLQNENLVLKALLSERSREERLTHETQMKESIGKSLAEEIMKGLKTIGKYSTKKRSRSSSESSDSENYGGSSRRQMKRKSAKDNKEDIKAFEVFLYDKIDRLSSELERERRWRDKILLTAPNSGLAQISNSNRNTITSRYSALPQNPASIELSMLKAFKEFENKMSTLRSRVSS